MAKFSIAEILKEARRRRVFRVAAIYVVGAWVLLQVAENAFPGFDIPESAIRYVYLGVLLTFPLAIVFGWRYDFIRGRIVRTLKADENADLALQRSDYLILAMLAVVFIAITIGLGGEISETQPPDLDSGWAENVNPASIAVLPFVNMSPDPDNAYFADGLSEELLNGLAKIDGLHVIARTSSFSLRGQALEMKEIGRKLGVAFVLEGSVRLAGDRLRITAQLIDARVDAHRWSNTFDQPTGDIFEIQDDIASSVIAELKNNLEQDSSVPGFSAGTSDVVAYNHYLQGLSAIRNSNYDQQRIEVAIEHFHAAVSIDSSFHDARVSLTQAYLRLKDYSYHNYQPDEAAKAGMAAVEAAKAGFELAEDSDVKTAEWWMLLGSPDEKMEAARTLVANNTNSNSAYRALAEGALRLGDIESALDAARAFHALDPLNSESSELVAVALTKAGKLREASDYYRISSQLEISSGREIPNYEEMINIFATIAAAPFDIYGPVHLHMGVQGECSDNFSLTYSDDSYSGRTSALFASKPDAPGWCNTGNSFGAEPYRGLYIRLTGMLKAEHAERGGALWLRVDSEVPFSTLGFDTGAPDFLANSANEWLPYEITLYVPHDAYLVLYGVSLGSEGKMWMNDFRFELSDTPNFD